MVFKVLDASAFYAGIPFSSQEVYQTTTLVYDEISHIKKNHDAIGILFQTKRLQIRDPQKESIDKIIQTSKETGDFQHLSKPDVSIIALALELRAELITDDFAISNVAKTIGIKIFPIMTSGISRVGRWIHYCSACHITSKTKKECPRCGNPLRKKLV